MTFFSPKTLMSLNLPRVPKQNEARTLFDTKIK